MMMEMSPFGRAGTFLGFWTLVVTFARGIGVSGGGIVRDVALQLSGSLSISYGAVFVLGAVGLGVSLYILSQIQAVEREEAPAEAPILAGALD
jgi:MFS-type transporter involved in bile tolerance (Atg22 family)